MSKLALGKRRIQQLCKEQAGQSKLSKKKTSITDNLIDFSISDTPEYDQNSPVFTHISYGCVSADELPDQSSDSESLEYSENIRDQLKDWALCNSINHVQFTSLLKILKSHSCFNDLPSDSRTVLKIGNIPNILQCEPGTFAYFGLAKYLNSVVNCKSYKIKSEIELNVNIDGLPISRSTSAQFWPILCSVEGHEADPKPILIYKGDQKPANVNDFLSPFVSELKTLCDSNFVYKNTSAKIKVRAFVCDTPARSFILCTKGHAGYSACGKCTVEGEYTNNRMTFGETTSAKRTNDTFRQRQDDNHHIGTSILETLESLDMVKCFPMDYMHLVCLGVVKKLLNLWVKGKPGSAKLSSRNIQDLSNAIVGLSSHTVLEFARKPRAIKELDRWKATEFRNFLLYVGPIVLQSVLPEEHYTHFMCLSVAISILVNPNTYETLNHYAEELLLFFVNNFSELYTVDNISFNVHGLIHLAADAKHLGPLDTFSAFKYENQLGKIKKMLRSPNKPLEQTIRRIAEQDLCSGSNKSIKEAVTMQHCSTIENPTLCNPQYSKYSNQYYCINTNLQANRYVMLTCGSIVEVTNICSQSSTGELVIVGNKFTTKVDWYSNPCNSSILKSYKISDLCDDVKVFPLTDIATKCQVYPKDGNLIAFALPHCRS